MYMVGWNKQEIQIQPKGYAMFGYGMWSHRAYEKRSPLYARTFTIREAQKREPIIICCLDFGCITYAMRSGVVESLKQQLKDRFDEQQLLVLATHTHSGPGGCAYEALYNMPTPGFVPEHLAAVVDAAVTSIIYALEAEQQTEIRYGTSQFDTDVPVAWNRALKSYNRNPDVQQRSIKETHLALNREMQLIGFYRNDQLCSFISLFGVHATCLGNKLKAYDGDNKGYAAGFSEQYLQSKGNLNPVTIFAQTSAGDVSPHFHGLNQDTIRNKIQGEQEYQYAQQNGRYQSDLAIQALLHCEQKMDGELTGLLSYVDLSQVEIPTEFSNGINNAKTSAACHGVAFFGGTPVDGKGAAKPITMVMSLLSKQVRKKRLANPNGIDYLKYKTLYDSQAPKDIVLESPDNRLLGKDLDFQPSFLDPLIAEMNRQVKAGAIQNSPLVPSVSPLQILKLGQLVLVCCPGEVTTTAGQRLVQTVYKVLSSPLSVGKVWLASYCNDYMGYITTNEEYQQQGYEGGHTLFGQWTHAAIQFKFQQLARQLNVEKSQRDYDQVNRPATIPQHEIDQRTNHGSLKTAVR